MSREHAVSCRVVPCRAVTYLSSFQVAQASQRIGRAACHGVSSRGAFFVIPLFLRVLQLKLVVRLMRCIFLLGMLIMLE